MKRIVKPELLDHLPPDDLHARHSRNDLARLNAWMGNASILARQLECLAEEPTPRRLLDLGAGDGRFIWQVAKRLSNAWRGTRVDLLDRQSGVSPQARRGLEELGWNVRELRADVGQFFSETPVELWSAISANLFLHHFAEVELVQVLKLISERTVLFVAIDPRRSIWGLMASRLVGFIGCNQVTRHDAVLSVYAGFNGKALSELWPNKGTWSMEERRAGFFSHLFVARKNQPAAIRRSVPNG